MNRQGLIPAIKRPRSELALDILRRWRNDPGNKRWTKLLERAAWLLQGEGSITLEDAVAELDHIPLAELFEIEKNGGKLPRFPVGLRRWHP